MVHIPCMLCVVINLSKVFHHLVPRRTTYVLQDDNRWLMLLDPLKHTPECPSGFTVGVDVLLHIIEIGVVDTGCPGNENLQGQLPSATSVAHINVARNLDK